MLSAVRKIHNFNKHIHMFKLKFQNDKVFTTHSFLECSRTVTQMFLIRKITLILFRYNVIGNILLYIY